MFVEQVRRFWSFSDRLYEIADPERMNLCTAAIVYVAENPRWLPFSQSVDKELAPPDRDFIAKMMKLDPRDRSTAKGLLQKIGGSTHEAPGRKLSLGYLNDQSQI